MCGEKRIETGRLISMNHNCLGDTSLFGARIVSVFAVLLNIIPRKSSNYLVVWKIRINTQRDDSVKQ